MTIRKVNSLMKEYGVPGGMITLVGTYAAFFTEKIFPLPSLDPILLEKIMVLLFGIVFLTLLYIFRYFERKSK